MNSTHEALRLQIQLSGPVQGVGFRPFIHNLAVELRLTGFVRNDGAGVTLEIEGLPEVVDRFVDRIRDERPSKRTELEMACVEVSPRGGHRFCIATSAGGAATAVIQPDLAICADCLRELLDPSDRRFAYPFVNCTNCGPRFSIVHRLPYDRANTTMAGFDLCPACVSEYHDPSDRRFHAQATACADCGPRLELLTGSGEPVALRERAFQLAVDALRRGRIVALKGLGGFQLLVDAAAEPAVRTLRERKGRDEKPFALMCADLAAARELCEVSDKEAGLLRSPAAPIVLLTGRRDAAVAQSVAPGSPDLALMLPSTPLHHLLLRAVGRPVVATSGNRSAEPICIEEGDALRRLAGIADVLLAHDRRIVRPIDDSVVRVVLDRPLIIRRARGYAPTPLRIEGADGILAAGAHLKNTIALGRKGKVHLSQHVADLDSPQARALHEATQRDLQALYPGTISRVMRDLHPDYASTHSAIETAARLEATVVPVQHHLAHVLACMADNSLSGPCLGVAWDGTGLGDDGTVWGGEFFAVDADDAKRVACLRPFLLPGGDRAAREPRRSALGALFAAFGEEAFGMTDLAPLARLRPPERRLQLQALRARVGCVTTSSAGRLFDAVAALCDLGQSSSYEGQVAMRLEWAAREAEDDGVVYPLPLKPLHLDWRPALRAVVDDLRAGVPVPLISRRFHATLADAIVRIARRTGRGDVVISGGCFQNAILLRETVRRVEGAGMRAHWPRDLPPGDGALSLGQIVAATRG